MKDRFNQKNWFGSQEKRKVPNQVYRVKKDGRKDKSPDLNSSDEKLVKMLKKNQICVTKR